MTNKILLTGGGGFIGTHLTEALRNDSYIVIYDNFRRDSLTYVETLRNSKNVRVTQGDILDAKALEQAMQDVDTVIHLAAIAGVSTYYTDPLLTLKVNILGTLNVLDTMLKTGAKTIIDFSTSEVYGVMADNVDEEQPHGIGPVSQKRWVYATSKLASEHLTLRYAEAYGLQGICLRPFNIYGPRQTGEGAIRNFLVNLKQGSPIKIYGDGSDIRAWCYVSDMVDAVKLILRKASLCSGMAFNIGNPAQAFTTKQLAELIIKTFGIGTIEYIEAEHAPIRKRIPDITRARTVLGFEPKVSLVQGLGKTMEWFWEVF